MQEHKFKLGDFVLKIRVETFVLKISGIQKNLTQIWYDKLIYYG